MSMSAHVVGIRPPDEKWKKMKAVWDACTMANTSIPQEVRDFFGCEPPDKAGVVVEVGSRVTRFRPGDAVYASLFDLGRGALAQWVVVPEHAAALKPASLDFVQAASIPMVALTAWQAFTEQASLAPGQRVFIPAGSGGIGSFTIQLARHRGAFVAPTTSTANAGSCFARTQRTRASAPRAAAPSGALGLLPRKRPSARPPSSMERHDGGEATRKKNAPSSAAAVPTST